MKIVWRYTDGVSPEVHSSRKFRTLRFLHGTAVTRVMYPPRYVNTYVKFVVRFCGTLKRNDLGDWPVVPSVCKL